MRLVHVLRGMLVVLIGAAVLVIVNGLRLRYYVRTGPGPGFFPIWVGGILAGCGLLLLGQSFFDGDRTERFFLSREAALRVLTIVLSLAVVWAGLEYLGFRLAVFAFAIIVPRVLGSQSWAVTAGVALTASFGVAYGFEKWLGIQLPRSTFEPLAAIGF